MVYLLWLRSALGAWLGRLTVEQVCQMFIKPRTARSRGSVASELMLQADTSDYVGEATHGATPLQTRWTLFYCFSKGATTLRLRKCGSTCWLTVSTRLQCRVSHRAGT